MGKLHRTAATVALLTILSQPAGAAGLLDIYRDAVSADPVLRQADSDRLADRESKPQARALWLPRISAGADLTQNLGVDRPGSDSSFDSRGVNINLSQAIYNRANLARLRQADSLVGRADATFAAAEDDLVLRVAEAYFQTLSAQDSLTFTVADKNAIARQLEQAKQRFEVGLVTVTDVQEAQARFDLVNADEIVALNTLSDRKEELRRITGELYEKLDLLSERMPLKLPDPAEAEQWVEIALSNNPALQSAGLGVEIARENVEVERSGHYPTLDLVAGYSDNVNDGENTNGGQIGLQLEVPLFEGFAVSSRSREAAFRFESAKERREEQLRAVVTQVRNAYRGVAASISQVKALDQARTSNRSALEATEAGFEVGTRTIVDVLNAQRDLFRAERDYSVSRYSYVLNMLALKQAAGAVDEEDVAEIQSWLSAPKK